MKTRDMVQEPGNDAELISALVDGQLKGDVFARTVDCLTHSDAARASWHSYHVVGEVLRSGETQAGGRDAAFLQRLRVGLQQSSVLAPVEEVAMSSPTVPAETSAATSASINLWQSSANDAYFSRKYLAFAASFAAVVLTGWTLLGGFEREEFAGQLAQTALPGQLTPGEPARIPSLAQAEPLVMMRDPRLDALLAAHKQFGGTSALQTPAGFLRNATFEGAAR